MTSDVVLKLRASKITDKQKIIMIKTYVLAQYEIVALDDGEIYSLSEEGKEIAEYLLKSDKWKKEANDFREELRKAETLH